jgi:hypothetical protein
LGIFLWAGFSGETASASQTPAQVNAAVYHAATTSGSFHYLHVNSSQTDGTDIKVKEIGDVGRNEGIQYTTGTLGQSEIIVLGSMAYMKGDVSALQYQLGLPQREATTYANRWISLTAADSEYSNVIDLVTLRSFWNNPKVNAFLSVSEVPRSTTTGRFDGQDALSIDYSIDESFKSTHSTFVGSSRLFTSAKSPHLPIASISSTTGKLEGDKDVQKDSGTFTKWGESVNVVAPTGALPFSSLPPPPSS